MPIDMAGPHRHNPEVHYRRYLSHRASRITVICVQDFDYYDYEPSRFVDLASFDSEGEALSAPLQVEDVIGQMCLLDGDDYPGIMQVARILHAMNPLPLANRL
ncbi:hypothetical protein PV516_19050 [Streptomyces scabiei]|uniref:hypothetical protein n=1 Tax=Streptomyces scabiei TaxID=1930 RepID=UPI0029B308AA|nr:hypothetical protein [Streptomyces scabiei]MDX3165886.1 hypothetical protein [Streptomyces scabiei]